MLKRKQTIGVGLIVKNEAANIVQCLSQFEWADVICVVDTGSSDNTVDIARAYLMEPDKVISYTDASEKVDGEWMLSNFAKARNVYVDRLDPIVDYIMTVSVGNEIPESHKIPEVIQTNRTVYAFDVVRGGCTFTHHRLFKTKCGIRYQGAVHEVPIFKHNATQGHSGIKIIHEAGNAQSQEGSIKRNLRILELEYKRSPTNRTLFYYAYALKDAGLYKEAAIIFREYLEKPVSYHDERMYAYLNLMRCLRRSGGATQSIKTGYKALSEDDRFSEIRMEMAYELYDQKRYEESLGLAISSMVKPPKTMMFLETDAYTSRPIKLIEQIERIRHGK